MSSGVKSMGAGKTSLLEPSRWKWFFVAQKGHTFISEPRFSTAASAGVPLKAFLKAQIDDDPSWCPVTPAP